MADSLSLGTAAARKLASTTKTAPQMREITPRHLLRILPWVEAPGGVFRVNRRLSYQVGDGQVTFTSTGARVQVIPNELREVLALREFQDGAVLAALADRFVQRELQPGDVIVEAGQPIDELILVAHGKILTSRSGQYGGQQALRILASGDHLGGTLFSAVPGTWDITATAMTSGTVLSLSGQALNELLGAVASLREHLDLLGSDQAPERNKYGEAAIALASGHTGEAVLPGTFVDYDLSPREYELSVAQTILRVHTRVADLYSEPMDQTKQQLRLTIEALRERQEDELLNNRDFGLLHNADLKQRIHTRTGPPTPDDLDELLSKRRKTQFYLAHPLAIRAFGRECNSRGLHAPITEVDGHRVTTWRNVPIMPCDKIPITDRGLTSIIAMRTGQEDQGVIGLRRTGLPHEYEPGLSVRFMGIGDKGITSHLVTTYFSAAVLVPDALGVLESVEIR